MSLDTARQNPEGAVTNFTAATGRLDSAQAKLTGETEHLVTSVPTCDGARFSGEKGKTSAYIHSSDDDGNGAPLLNYTQRNGARCSSATIVGRLTYTPNEDEIVAMPFGAHAAEEQVLHNIAASRSVPSSSDRALPALVAQCAGID